MAHIFPSTLLAAFFFSRGFNHAELPKEKKFMNIFTQKTGVNIRKGHYFNAGRYLTKDFQYF